VTILPREVFDECTSICTVAARRRLEGATYPQRFEWSTRNLFGAAAAASNDRPCDHALICLLSSGCLPVSILVTLRWQDAGRLSRGISAEL
jgi:hypothetical protein